MGLECELWYEGVCHFSSVVQGQSMTDLKKTGGTHVSSIVSILFVPLRGHQSCQLLIYLKATKLTPVNVCKTLVICVCV